MPTKVPRIAVTLSPEARKLVEEVAELTDRSHSAIVSELLDSALPALQAVRDAMRVIKQQPHEAQRLMARVTNQALVEVAQASLDLDAAIDARSMKGKRRKSG